VWKGVHGLVPFGEVGAAAIVEQFLLKK